jgi:hypothetical protein
MKNKLQHYIKNIKTFFYTLVGGNYHENELSLILDNRMRNNWQNFLLSVLFGGILFGAPLYAEYMHSGSISEKTFTLALSMYAISQLIVSKERLIVGLNIGAIIMLLINYSSLKEDYSIECFLDSKPLLFYSMFFLYSVERFMLHILDKEEFWGFFKNK